jgi:hypothetical protein
VRLSGGHLVRVNSFWEREGETLDRKGYVCYPDHLHLYLTELTMWELFSQLSKRLQALRSPDGPITLPITLVGTLFSNEPEEPEGAEEA